MHTNPHNLGKRLKDLVQNKGISENELAKQIGINRQSMRRLINNNNYNPGWEIIEQVNNFLDETAINIPNQYVERVSTYIDLLRNEQ